jgi:alkaline phosphatase
MHHDMSKIRGFAAIVLAAVIAPSVTLAEGGAKNVILFIADGLGYNHIIATNYYQHGEDRKQVYENGFTQYPMSTYSVRGKYEPDIAWESFLYFKVGASDSAGTATTLATGVKTLNGAIGVDQGGEPLRTILDKAEELEKSTGVVSSVQIGHATPASFVAHNKSRGNVEDITRQMIAESPLEVIFGAGHPEFGESGEPVDKDDESYRYVGGLETWEAVRAGKAGADADGDGEPDPWTLVESRAGFQQLMEGDTPKRVLGLAPIRSSLQVNRDGVDDVREDDDPFQTPLLETSPTLAELTSAALNVLDNNPNGFCVSIEGGAVDWASHANAAGRMIEEMIDFGAAVEAAMAWVEENSSWDETLIVVTGDHECGYLMGPDADPEHTPIVNNGKGKMPGYSWHSTSHTNQLIPLFVKGAGAEKFEALADEEDPVRGKYIDNAEVGALTMELLE